MFFLAKRGAGASCRKMLLCKMWSLLCTLVQFVPDSQHPHTHTHTAWTDICRVLKLTETFCSSLLEWNCYPIDPQPHYDLHDADILKQQAFRHKSLTSLSSLTSQRFKLLVCKLWNHCKTRTSLMVFRMGRLQIQVLDIRRRGDENSLQVLTRKSDTKACWAQWKSLISGFIKHRRITDPFTFLLVS